MNCSNCGFELKADSKFCPICGTPNNTPSVENNEDLDATVAVSSVHNQPTDSIDETVAVSSAAAVNNVSVPAQPDSFDPAASLYDPNYGMNDMDSTVRLDPATPVPPVTEPPKNEKPPKKKKNKAAIIIICIIVALLLIGGGLFACMHFDIIPNPFDKSDEKTEEKKDDDEEEEEDKEEKGDENENKDPEADENTPADKEVSKETAISQTKPIEETEPEEEENEITETEENEPEEDTSDNEVETAEPEEEEAVETPDVSEVALTENMISGKWEGSVDIRDLFSNSEYPSMPISGTYVFDGNGTLTRTLDTEECSNALLDMDSDSALAALSALVVLAFDGDTTFDYTLEGDKILINDGKSELTYNDGVLSGKLAGCDLTLTRVVGDGI